MPATSLVVCLFKERALLERLLSKVAGCYDDLVVVHDGPDIEDVRSLVESMGGRFFEGERAFQQEPHWAFAWGQAKHDWILRLDADEFPSPELKQWLLAFRQGPEPDPAISGYSCIWPLWNGHRAVSKKWPAGRFILFHRQRVRFFGMVEQTPSPDGRCERLDLVLEHQPRRKSYGAYNVLIRPQAKRWRECIASSLLGKPTDLSCWRWEKETWPTAWEQIRSRPLRTAFSRLFADTLRSLRDQWKAEHRLYPEAAVSGPLHHALICLLYRRLRKKNKQPSAPSSS